MSVQVEIKKRRARITGRKVRARADANVCKAPLARYYDASYTFQEWRAIKHLPLALCPTFYNNHFSFIFLAPT